MKQATMEDEATRRDEDELRWDTRRRGRATMGDETTRGNEDK